MIIYFWLICIITLLCRLGVLGCLLVELIVLDYIEFYPKINW